MTTIQGLIKKQCIDVNDDINFRTHADVLRLFGKDVKIYQRAMASHPRETDLHIWFPMFYDDTNNDWENTFGVKEETVFERRKYNNEQYLEELIERPDLHKRILFAKVSPFGRVLYKFKGIYTFDIDLSRKAKKAVYRRTATSAKIYTA